MVVEMMTTNLFSHPVFKEGAFTANDRSVRRFSLRKTMRNIDLAAELGAQTYVAWGGREGAESDAAKDVRAALDRYEGGLDTLVRLRARPGLPDALRHRAETERASWRHPAADRSATLSPSSTSWSTPRWSGSTPRWATRPWPGLNVMHGYAQALWSGKLFHIDLNGQHGLKYDQDLRFGAADLKSCLLPGRPAGIRRLRRRQALRLQAAASRGHRRGVGVRRRLHADLPDPAGKGAAWRADPEVKEAMAAAGVPELSRPTLAPGETLADLLSDRCALRGLRRRGRRQPSNQHRAARPAGPRPHLRGSLSGPSRPPGRYGPATLTRPERHRASQKVRESKLGGADQH